ncbi:hypothetical protein [Halorubrum sp. 2020YC2]|uniref:hypothetical protein n=1 Tax=Halorubrum sp. 2020YC2 TaxID=2836432 RepID=UPI001BE81EA3|nr:hypothetical protein [Halorubrum sp. 2020YC2]QWC18262.1 hypothetical protein KI388_08795 [Halorubrum sp. 2020YC2]
MTDASEGDGGRTEGRSESDGTASGDDSEDPLAAAGVDPVVPDEASDAEFPADAEVREFLRDVAEDVRGDSSESKQLSAVLYRVSDLYDETEETSPEEIYLNVRHIMRIKAEGGLRR